MSTSHHRARITLAAISLLVVMDAVPGFSQTALAQLRAKVNHIVVNALEF